jgi:hypothetical protein
LCCATTAVSDGYAASNESGNYCVGTTAEMWAKYGSERGSGDCTHLPELCDGVGEKAVNELCDGVGEKAVNELCDGVGEKAVKP